MARLPDFGEVPGVPCDCGEALATVHLAEVSLCDDCFEQQAREHMKELFGRDLCCTILWPNSDTPTLCLRPMGHGFHD